MFVNSVSHAPPLPASSADFGSPKERSGNLAQDATAVGQKEATTPSRPRTARASLLSNDAMVRAVNENAASSGSAYAFGSGG
jgi:hypothetical protein